MLTESDKKNLEQRGITTQQVEQQLEQFKTGFPFSDIQRPATIGDGIAAMDEKEAQKYVGIYNNALNEGKRVVKFIPASGAATRMFKSTFEFKNADAEKQKTMADEKPYAEFFKRLGDFAFAEELQKFNPKNNAEIISAMLDENGLGYGQKPKGVLLFHKYPQGPRTAAEEHIMEGFSYACSNGEINLHFTVSPQHLELFKNAVKTMSTDIETRHNCKVNITYSFQKPSTDTLAATMDNEPFRNEQGELVFRPGGHGALIENLNDIDADIVFIKNIDNVAQEHLLTTTAMYKKAIAGYALERKSKIDSILKKLDEGEIPAIAEALDFMKNELKTTLPAGFDAIPNNEKIAFIKNALDRPLRVCGMVKNEGEPGGGPFWVRSTDGQAALQVVESAQIDTNDPKKAEIMKQSTHFNPVDLFCCVTDRYGKKYDLKEFVDYNAGFISYKSLNGRDLKAMELPGLWNGAMAKWLTFFVEVPIATFNPVKTVMDLLRPQHQPA